MSPSCSHPDRPRPPFHPAFCMEAIENHCTQCLQVKFLSQWLAFYEMSPLPINYISSNWEFLAQIYSRDGESLAGVERSLQAGVSRLRHVCLWQRRGPPAHCQYDKSLITGMANYCHLKIPERLVSQHRGYSKLKALPGKFATPSLWTWVTLYNSHLVLFSRS